MRTSAFILSVVPLAVEASYEWGGIFATPQSTYTWIAQSATAGQTNYADPSMKMVVLTATDAEEATLKALEDEAKHGFEETCTVVEPGGTITPTEDACFELHFEGGDTSSFTINAANAANMAIFTAHLPSEFERDTHYFQDASSADVEPAHTLSGDSHDGHDHGSQYAFEWAGIFPTPEKHYLWTAQATEGKHVPAGEHLAYVDPGMKIAFAPTNDDAEATLTGLQQTGDLAIEGNCTDKHAGDTLTVISPSVCYHLHFDTEVWQSLYKIDTMGFSHVAIFAQHKPTEFENDAHYLKDDHAEDIEPAHELPEEDTKKKDKEWGAAIGAAILVMLCTFIGVVLLVPFFGNLAKKYPEMLAVSTNGFAAGALLAAAFYLMLYEATHLIPMDKKGGEARAAAEWGSMVLTGFVTAAILDLIVNSVMAIKGGETSTSSTEDKKDPESADVVVLDRSRQKRVLCGVLLGDFVHNLVDGFVLGAAFSNCKLSMAWTITASTIYHELGQEISDYVVLTDPKQGALKPAVALLLNFLSGFSVLIGIIIMMSTNVDNFALGMLLAFGAGVYIQIGGAECMPRVYEAAKTINLRVASIAFFTLGALAIGLVLLDHEHCVAEDGGGGDAHAGHDHGR